MIAHTRAGSCAIVGGERLLALIAGPCVIEDEDLAEADG